MPNVKLKKKKISSWTLLGVTIYLRKIEDPNNKNRYWALEVKKLDFERIKGALWRILEHDVRSFGPTQKLYRIITNLTNKKDLLAVLKKQTPAES